ncbi:MAG TPA: hypothetical protein VMN03_14090, partial [Burkholderiales bacterium]|nr:hypothetical protein [Burkholderiales bacterium]
MVLSAKAKVLAAFIVTVLVGFAAVSAFAGPGGSSHGPTDIAGAEPTEEPEPTEAIEPASEHELDG